MLSLTFFLFQCICSPLYNSVPFISPRLPPQSVISEDNPRSGPALSTHGSSQGLEEEETQGFGLAERGLQGEVQLSYADGPAALPIQSAMSRNNQEPDTCLKHPRSRGSPDETKSSPQAEKIVGPVKPLATGPSSMMTESSSQARKKPSPMKPFAAAAVVRPSAIVQPMVRKPPPDSQQTEVKRPVDASQTTPKVYQRDEAMAPIDPTHSEEEEREDPVEEDGETGKGHAPSREGRNKV